MSRAISGRAHRGSDRGSDAGSAVRTVAPMRALQDYLVKSELPLTSLLFLLPLIILYEVGTFFFASDWARHTETRVLAFSLITQFMHLFGATGRWLPGLAVIVILLAWHIARRDPWRLEIGITYGMAGESALLGLPLLAMSHLVGLCLPLAAASAAGAVESSGSLWRGGVILAVGAGIYEELVFRLFACTMLHILLIDLCRINRRIGNLLMVLGSAVLFSAYHYWSPSAPPFRLGDAVFRTAAGVYFGVLFLTRGFGITAGAHAAYDIYFFTLHALAQR